MTEPVPLWRVRDMLAEVSSERPLPREAASALQHAELVKKIEPEVASAVYGEVKALPYVNETLAAKIVDILPETPEDVWLLLPKDSLPLDETQVKTILDTLAKHR